MSSYVSSAKNSISNIFVYLGNKLHNQDETNKYLRKCKKLKDLTRIFASHIDTHSLEDLDKLSKAVKENHVRTSRHLVHKKNRLLIESTMKDLSLVIIPTSLVIRMANCSSWSRIFCIIATAFYFHQLFKNKSMKSEIIELDYNIRTQKLLLLEQNILRSDIKMNSIEKEASSLIPQRTNVINSNIKNHQIAKITSISCFALCLVAATIGSLSVIISTSLLGVGLISAIATKYFSKKIESDYQEIAKIQKENKLNCNYQLNFNKLFYLKINAPA
ncbi:MAG: hypothetical protein K940chlam5_00958 [Candidatus Anoxychlamydiales bacterium]|nr:hypothetical protein [Candidatus Anoxychlamydiales bacterium]